MNLFENLQLLHENNDLTYAKIANDFKEYFVDKNTTSHLGKGLYSKVSLGMGEEGITLTTFVKYLKNNGYELQKEEYVDTNMGKDLVYWYTNGTSQIIIDFNKKTTYITNIEICKLTKSKTLKSNNINKKKLENDIAKVYEKWANQAIKEYENGEWDDEDIKWEYNYQPVGDPFAVAVECANDEDGQYTDQIFNELIKMGWKESDLWDDNEEDYISDLYELVIKVGKEYYDDFSYHN